MVDLSIVMLVHQRVYKYAMLQMVTSSCAPLCGRPSLPSCKWQGSSAKSPCDTRDGSWQHPAGSMVIYVDQIVDLYFGSLWLWISINQNHPLYPMTDPWCWYIYANIGDILMVNVTIYSIHGSYGYIYVDLVFASFQCISKLFLLGLRTTRRFLAKLRSSLRQGCHLPNWPEPQLLDTSQIRHDPSIFAWLPTFDASTTGLIPTLEYFG